MENKINDMVEHLSYSQKQMARIFEAQRHAAVRMSQIISSLPNRQLQSPETLMKSDGGQVEQVNGSITAYLNAMADLQQNVADTLEIAMKELRVNEQVEE
ncbi:nucleoside-diphosphate sugar epimerase [Paenibacillus faecalis]|uniref:nucleoside-diphosphate sugar epimerase n=1 Tax=Paenibacillus faecalis TaxID=2079532 RepID=UPI000D0E3F76|nr:nucleoside-diphosphate sugar epimerase [Paenibacillus faecalis]